MILDTIVAATKARVAKLKESVPLELIKAKAEVIARAELAKQGGQFPFAFEKALRAGSMNFICEVKKPRHRKALLRKISLIWRLPRIMKRPVPPLYRY